MPLAVYGTEEPILLLGEPAFFLRLLLKGNSQRHSELHGTPEGAHYPLERLCAHLRVALAPSPVVEGATESRLGSAVCTVV